MLYLHIIVVNYIFIIIYIIIYLIIHLTLLNIYLNIIVAFLFLLLHRACCRVTQLLHQRLDIYKIFKIYTLKH